MASLWSTLIVVILISQGGEAAIAISADSECEYLIYNFPDWTLVQTLVPSVDAACLALYNEASDSTQGDAPSWCTVECKSMYDLYSRCVGQYYADLFISSYCGSYKNISCYLYENYTYLYDVYALCNSSTSCGDSCRTAITALENYSGCCTSDSLNGPKVLCGEQIVEPCPTMINGDCGVRLSALVLMAAAFLVTIKV